MRALLSAEDRSMSVPAGNTVHTGYVPIEALQFASKDRMDVAAVEKAMQRRLGIQPNLPWPPPIGEWKGERFIVHDGRHCAAAALLLGVEHILVAWVEQD